MRKQLLLGLLLLLIGVAVGRYSLPAKIMEKTITDTQKDIQKDDHTITTVVSVKQPDGTVTTTTEQKNDVTTTSEQHKHQDAEKTVTYNTQKVTLSALMTTRPFSGIPMTAYGGVLQYRVLGGITVGVLGVSDGTLGVTIGLAF